MNITIERVTDPNKDERVINLINKLNDSLVNISGSNGTKRANLDDFTQEKALFIIALSVNDAVACGGFRPLLPKICEVKRMFSLEKGKGLGLKILSELETTAKQFDYQHIYLETRKNNDNAVSFYLKNGYEVIENYGVYIGREEAICFGKELK
ncbi:GNAT family N-acetyltransferase [Chryseobacterium vrystaatense]|uniref:Acetyltransferase (GNAT) family protein n=1 Tax=Chryseobacterium vrystaatense TaxID=307480 RepID=A0A1M5BR92_9FLAO|nr:GNAT family N-acetyltransferase [Chryseobacterium vrystaatense]SHF44975.1 Acetyltransferase (GNAT) family protein [Chryseobacterium vrystaatense]